MSCCKFRCNQGKACDARRRLVNVARSLVGYAIVIGCLMSAAASVAVWLSLPTT